MQTFLRWLAAIFAVAILMGGFFALYSHFLVDYSLESLETAGRLAERGSVTTSATGKQVYRQLMQNVLLDEAAKEDADLRNLAFIQLATRSGADDAQGDYRSRYKFYLSEVQQEKNKKRFFLLRAIDLLHRQIEKVRGYAAYFWSYVRGKLTVKKEVALDLTSAVLLSQAEASEKTGDFDRSVSLYEKYLERNPDDADSGYIRITLAGIKVKQKKWQDAEVLLRRTRRSFAGQEESRIADDLLHRIEILKAQWQELEKTERDLAQETQIRRTHQLKFKLGLINLRLERFDEAKGFLGQLDAIQDKDLQLKARFYLGWIHKLQQDYGVSEEILSVLADDPLIDEELRNGIKAELADIYYRQGDEKSSLQQYHSIAGDHCNEVNGESVLGQAWVGLAELEKSFLYYNVGDQVKAGESIGCLTDSYKGQSSLVEIQKASETGEGENIQLTAFVNLQRGRVEQARQLFERSKAQEPDNYLNYSGLAMVDVLSSNLDAAQKSAQRGYQMKKTEYSASVLGYIMAFQNDPRAAIAFYLQAMEMNSSYFSARFNLASLYLKTRQYREALKHLLELERSMPDKESLMYSKVLNNLGCALWWVGKEDEAVARLELAMRVTPGYVDAELNLKQIRLERIPQPVTVPQRIQVEG